LEVNTFLRNLSIPNSGSKNKLNKKAEPLLCSNGLHGVISQKMELFIAIAIVKSYMAPCYLLHAGFLPSLFFDLEDRDDMFLRNVC
jgi:hypothetical protein